MELEILRRGSYNKRNQDMKISEDSWKSIGMNDAKELVDSNYEVLKMSRTDEDIYFMKWEYAEVRLNEGRVVELIKGFLRKKTKIDKCPYCGSSIVSPALSRRGNEIEICSKCGEREAFEDMLSRRGD